MGATTAFALVLGLFVLGRFLSARGVVPADAPTTLNLVVLHVSLPAAVLLHAPSFAALLARPGLVALPWLLFAGSAGFTWAIAAAFRFDRESRAVLLLLGALGNTSFLGYALVPALAGASALPHAVVFDQFGSFLILSTVGLVVIAAHGGDPATPARIARRIASFPPLIALVVALVVGPLPAAVVAALAPVAAMLLPLVALACGMQLTIRLPRGHGGPLAAGLLTKLVLLPLAALAACPLLGLDGDARLAAVYESGMPPMITAGALLSLAGLAPELAAALVGVGLVASMATLAAWHVVLAP